MKIEREGEGGRERERWGKRDNDGGGRDGDRQTGRQ